jgi:hypothetical protein
LFTLHAIWNLELQYLIETQKNIMELLLKYKLTLLGLLLGALSGYLYYFYIGCYSGTCPITSQPGPSTMYGAVMGALILNSFKKSKKTEEEGSL